MNQKVLIADPDESLREAVQAAAADFGAECLTAVNDGEAFQLFVEQGPEVVFVDALLPRKGAFDLIRRIRQAAGGDETIIYVTTALAAAATALREEALGTWGAKAVFSKPLDDVAVRTELDKVLVRPEPKAAKTSPLLGAVAKEGGFDRLGFPLVFSHAMRSPEPCRLAVMQGKVRKVVYFADGKVTFARSNTFSETLARHLLQRGLVTEDAYECGIQMAIGTGMRIGQCFVALGQVDPTTIDAAVRRNIMDKVLDLFTWQEGWYKLIGYEEPPANIPGGDIGGDSLLWSVVCETVHGQPLKNALEACADNVLKLGRPIEEMPGSNVVGGVATKLRELVDEGVGKGVGVLLEGRDEGTYQLVYFLLLCGFFAFDEVGESGDSVSILDPKLRGMLENIKERLAWASGRNYFQVLGVTTECSDDEVEEAYGKMAQQIDTSLIPDDADRDIFTILEEYQELIDKAHRTLTDPESKGNYLTTIRGAEEPQQDGTEILRAESVFRDGIGALRNREWEQAVEAFRAAASLNPSEPEYQLYWGIARLHQNTPTLQEALEDAENILMEAHRAAPSNAEPAYQLGEAYKKMGDAEKALSFYELALKLDPSHERASRKAKSLGGGAAESKGLLGSLFKGGKGSD